MNDAKEQVVNFCVIVKDLTISSEKTMLLTILFIHDTTSQLSTTLGPQTHSFVNLTLLFYKIFKQVARYLSDCPTVTTLSLRPPGL